jgi:hypothetical protein
MLQATQHYRRSCLYNTANRNNKHQHRFQETPQVTWNSESYHSNNLDLKTALKSIFLTIFIIVKRYYIFRRKSMLQVKSENKSYKSNCRQKLTGSCATRKFVICDLVPAGSLGHQTEGSAKRRAKLGHFKQSIKSVQVVHLLKYNQWVGHLKTACSIPFEMVTKFNLFLHFKK